MLRYVHIAHLGDISQSRDANAGVISQAATSSTHMLSSSLFTTRATIQHYIICYSSIVK
jgi:hypothetical protein